jgi:hypothetical protein
MTNAMLQLTHIDPLSLKRCDGLLRGWDAVEDREAEDAVWVTIF